MSAASRMNTAVSRPRTRQSIETSGNACSWLGFIREAVADAAHGADQFAFVSFIHLFPQMAHIHIHDIGESLEAFVPDVLDDHRAGEHPVGA